MRSVGLILVVVVLVVGAALTGFLVSGQSPVTAGPHSPATPDTSSPDGSGSPGAGGEAGSDGSPGDRPTGDRPTGDGPTGDGPTGDGPTRDGPTRDGPGGGAPWPNVFNAWTGGGDPGTDCAAHWRNGIPRSPYVGDGSLGHTTLFLGSDRQICLAGFDTHSEIALTIGRPDGSRQAVTVIGGTDATVGPNDLLTSELANVVVLADQEDGYLATDFEQLEPTMPVGTYVVTAEQGELSAEAVIELQDGALGDPELSYLKPQDEYEYAHSVRAGSQLTVLLLYFSPHATVPLAVYRNTGIHGEGGSDFEYVRELSTVKVNGQGWAYHRITVPASLPAAGGEFDPGYCVVTVPNLMVPQCQPYVDFTFNLTN